MEEVKGMGRNCVDREMEGRNKGRSNG